MTTQQQMQDAMQSFLKKYNKEHSVALALTSALKAATQRNALYTPKIDRTQIRKYWKELLESIGEKYVTEQKEATFIDDVKCLKCKMNQRFDGYFDNNSGKYDREFRISHAQKSLSIYLKHLWCMGKIMQPPLCPIDRTILKEVNPQNASWCYVNSPAIYQNHIKMIKEWKKKIIMKILLPCGN